MKKSQFITLKISIFLLLLMNLYCYFSGGYDHLYTLFGIESESNISTKVMIVITIILGFCLNLDYNGKIRDTLSKNNQVLLGILSIVLVISIYSYLSYNQHQITKNDTTIPNLSQFIEGIHKFTKTDVHGESWIISDLNATASRLFYGLAITISVSIVIGLLMGCKARWESFFLPVIRPFAKVPPTGAMAIFFAMLDTDTELYIGIIFFGIMPILTQNVYQAVKDVPQALLNKGRSLGASEMELVWDIIRPYIAPQVLISICLQIGPAIVYLIAAEMLVGSVGFGYRIRLESKILNMNVAYPYLAILAILATLLEAFIMCLNKKFNHWYFTQRK